MGSPEGTAILRDVWGYDNELRGSGFPFAAFMWGCRDCVGFCEKLCMFSRVPVGISFRQL